MKFLRIKGSPISAKAQKAISAVNASAASREPDGESGRSLGEWSATPKLESAYCWRNIAVAQEIRTTKIGAALRPPGLHLNCQS
jgi:hypothetical protein